MTAENILSQYEEKISMIGFAIRKFLLSELNDISEEAGLSAKIIGYNYGPGYSNLICTIIPSKKGIKLVFIKEANCPTLTNF